MTEKKTKLEPIRKSRIDTREFARQVREVGDSFEAEGRTFADPRGA